VLLCVRACALEQLLSDLYQLHESVTSIVEIIQQTARAFKACRVLDDFVQRDQACIALIGDVLHELVLLGSTFLSMYPVAFLRRYAN
jgi:hypothetical protein